MKKLLFALSAFVAIAAFEARGEDKPADDKGAMKDDGMKDGKKMKMKKGKKMKKGTKGMDHKGMKGMDHKDMKDMDHAEAPPAK